MPAKLVNDSFAGMSRLNLFEAMESGAVAIAEPCIETPIGKIIFRCFTEQVLLTDEQPKTFVQLPSGAKIFQINNDNDFQLELLVCNSPPYLTSVEGLESMKALDGCVGAMLRFMPIAEFTDLRFECSLKPTIEITDSGASPAERVACQTITTSQVELCIGTWENDDYDNMQPDDFVKYLPTGLCVQKHGVLQKGELIEIEFYVAWVKKLAAGGICELAVDPAYHHILTDAFLR
ncbi:MAG: hypothetical protein IAF08_04300 [Rhizobacter sp.]|nr:hypothetical protein [Chlorobiales bacterium]